MESVLEITGVPRDFTFYIGHQPTEQPENNKVSRELQLCQTSCFIGLGCGQTRPKQLVFDFRPFTPSSHTHKRQQSRSDCIDMQGDLALHCRRNDKTLSWLANILCYLRKKILTRGLSLINTWCWRADHEILMHDGAAGVHLYSYLPDNTC